MRRFGVGLLIIIAAVCLVLASTSLWTRRQVVNTDVFVATAEQAIATPAVQARISTQVVDSVMALPDVQSTIDQGVAILPPRLQAFRPTIEDGMRTLLDRGVSTLLTSTAFATVVRAGLTSAHTQLVNDQPVTFTLGQAKALVPPQARSGLAGQIINLIPSDLGVTVLTKQQAPQLYAAIDLLKSLWLWAGGAALAALVGALVLSRRRLRTLRAWAVTSGVLGLLVVFALTVARGPVLANVKPANVDAADAIYGIVADSARSWTLWLVAIMAVIFVGTLLWGRIGLLPAIGRAYRAAREHAARGRAERAQAKTAAAAGAADEHAPPWWQRIAEETRTFVDGLDLPNRLAAVSAVITRNLRVWRWGGVAVGAVILLFWPGPVTLSGLLWVAVLVGLYLGLLELIRAVAQPAVPTTWQEPAPVAHPTTAGAADETPQRADVPAGTAVPPGSATTSPPAAPVADVPAAPARPASQPVAETTAVETPVDETPVPERPGAGVPSVAAPTRDVSAPVSAAAPAAQAAAPAAAQATAPAPRTSAESRTREPDTEQSALAVIDSRLDLLVRLGDIRSAGLLTDEEFAQTKANLLGIRSS